MNTGDATKQQPHNTTQTWRLVRVLRTYLVQFPHRAQSFDLVRPVLPFLQTLVAHGRLALHAVHAQVLQLVLRACGDLARTRASTYPPLRRRHQAMLGEGAARRMAAQAARVAVEDVALLAHDGGLFGTLLAQLTLERGRFALLVPVHDALQHPVLGEAAETPIVQNEAAVTLRARDAGVAGDRRQGAGMR